MGKMNKFLNVLFFAFLMLSFHTISAQEGTVTVNQDEAVTTLLKLKKEVNKKASNYKIQVYSGTRSGAQNAQTKFNESFYSWPLSMEYETPNYKIWVGNFATRLEADKALIRIKNKFPNAFIFKPKKEK